MKKKLDSDVNDAEGAVERWEIGRLTRYPKNVKKHPDKQIRAMMRAIKRVGFRVPIEVDERGEIIAGHGRLTAAEKLGMTTVPVLVQRGLTEQQKREHRLADNRLAELAETDEEMLGEELLELAGMGSDLDALGYGERCIEREAERIEIEISEVQASFWLTIRGPMPTQPDVLNTLRAALEKIPGVEIEVGMI